MRRVAKPNVVVAEVREIGREPVAEQVISAVSGDTPHLPVTVGGVTGLLDMSNRRSAIWREVLESLRQMGRPAYVEVDPRTGVITDVLQPIPFRVTGITEDPDGLVVELEISQALHRLRRTNPDYDELAAALRAAYDAGLPVLVTENVDTDDIVDVRPQTAAEGE